MAYFDLSETVNPALAEIEKKDFQTLQCVISSDHEKGPQAVADLLTFLPEDQRMNAVKGFVLSMLCD